MRLPNHDQGSKHPDQDSEFIKESRRLEQRVVDLQVITEELHKRLGPVILKVVPLQSLLTKTHN